MRHQLKAVFDDRGRAQQALDELLGCGYARADALVVAVPGLGKAENTGGADTPSWRERPGTLTARLLSRLFNQEYSEPTRTTAVLRSPDSFVLTLATDSEPEAKRAASLISGFICADGNDAGTSTSAEQANAGESQDRQ